MAKNGNGKKPTPPTPPTAAPTPALIPQPHGGALLSGGTGAGGRPRDLWRMEVRNALKQCDGIGFLQRVVRGEELEYTATEDGLVEGPPKMRDRIVAANILIEHSYGKPPQELSVEDVTPRPTGEQIMARILELLPKVIPALPLDRKEIARLLAERRRVEVLVEGKVIE